MPSTAEITLTEPTLVIVPWYDEVVDTIGFDPRSAYCELFWLNVLGPTATWLIRRMVSGLDEYPGGYELDLPQTAAALGLTFAAGASNPFARSVNRCIMFGGAQPIDGGLAVRRRLPPVTTRQLARMPEYLRNSHAAWRHRTRCAADDEHRARLLADAMVAAGDPADAIERQLLGLGVPPAAAMRATAS